MKDIALTLVMSFRPHKLKYDHYNCRLYVEGGPQAAQSHSQMRHRFVRMAHFPFGRRDSLSF